MAWSVDSAIVSTEAYLNGRVDTTQNQIASTASQLKAALTVQGEEFEQLLAGVSTAYDVAVANGYDGSISQWLDSLRGPRGPEGPYGGASVTDPQVASYVGADTATRAALENGFIARRGTRGATRTIYVRATGDDANSGRTEQSAFREIKAAVNSLSSEGPVIRGSVIIDVGPGTYKGGITLPTTRTTAQDDFIKIIGPVVGGHPNIPTAVIDKAADETANTGIYAGDGKTLWLQDLKIVGAFNNAVDARGGSYLQWRNVHVDGAKIGGNIVGMTRYTVIGGIIENCTYGISELFGVTRDFGGAPDSAGQMIIRKCHVGVKAKENCVGHFDYINIHDCDVGLEMQLYSGANMRLAEFKRNGIGIVLTNSEIHNETSIVWGAGADMNTRRILSMGNSSELTLTGWDAYSGAPPAVRTGHRPLLMVASDYTERVVTGAATEKSIVSWASLLRADWFAIKGKRAKFVLWGTTSSNQAMQANYRILLRVATSLAAEVTLPAGLAGGSHFAVEFEMVATADGAAQRFLGRLLAGDKSQAYVASRSIDLSSGDRPVAFSAIAGNTTDSVTFRLAEAWG